LRNFYTTVLKVEVGELITKLSGQLYQTIFPGLPFSLPTGQPKLSVVAQIIPDHQGLLIDFVPLKNMARLEAWLKW
jgi:hypothetical protein